MGYGDYIPSGGHHHKKPLTKAQLRKMQETYKKADTISTIVRTKEKEEQRKVELETDELLNDVF